MIKVPLYCLECGVMVWWVKGEPLPSHCGQKVFVATYERTKKHLGGGSVLPKESSEPAHEWKLTQAERIMLIGYGIDPGPVEID